MLHRSLGATGEGSGEETCIIILSSIADLPDSGTALGKDGERGNESSRDTCK